MRLGIAVAFGVALAGAQQGAKLDLNSAPTAELEALPGIGRTTAQRIVRIRERNGPYRCIEELRAVPRLSEAQYRVLSEGAHVPGSDPRCEQQDAARRAGKPVIARRSETEARP
jgi:competence ComEA-like helix-hairpin-helix protein